MNEKNCWGALLIPLFLLPVSCANEVTPQPDPVNDPFPVAQAELRAVIESIVEDAMTTNIENLQTAHLESDKFTKFGPRSFDRQNVESTNASEAAHFGSISDFRQEIDDLKIDVFGDIGIATYYTHVSFVQDGEAKTGSGRQTLVFLNTERGWKIVHEHGTPKTAPIPQ